MGRVLPRHLQIIYEINARFLRNISRRFPFDTERMRRMSIIGEEGQKQVRMAHLAIVGSCSVNGVAKLHSELLKKDVLRDFAEYWPEKFNNKTNGITPRRWLLKANPGLAHLVTQMIGDKWITDLDQLRNIEPFVDDAAFCERFESIKHSNKETLARYIYRTLGVTISTSSLFDVQVKRMHEYKRQLLLILYVIVLYARLKKNPSLDI